VLPAHATVGTPGLLVRHPLTDEITAGAELFHRASTGVDTPDTSGVNVGVVIKLTEGRNLLASRVRAFQGVSANRGSFYFAYQLEM
jgi:putative IMPACT (imprinted ancient) family translation regulator